jgi:hypothetical protein
MPFLEAIHQLMKLELVQILWQRDPYNGSHHWYGEYDGWEISICDKDPEFCRVRIAFDKLQEAFPAAASCYFSSPDRSKRSSLFKIELGQVMEPG